MNWKKATRGNSVEEFVFEKTGKSIAQIIHMVPEYRIYRLNEVKNALFEAKLRNMLVTLVSDFDDDGIQSTLIMTYIFAAMGLKYQLIIPKRFSEGYGLSMKIIERVPNGGLLVTIDNGIKAIEPIAEAKRKGMKVIIMDQGQSYRQRILSLIRRLSVKQIIQNTVEQVSLINWQKKFLGKIIQL